jgi:DMSO/TMAO reductase YedYZ molybdopterin-dependent catalytic subunit
MMDTSQNEWSARILNRRGFLRAAAATLPTACAASAILRRSVASTDSQEPSTAVGQSEGLIVRQESPQNLEFPFAALKSFITPNELFYVRNHFPQPRLDKETWRLKVGGAVKRPLELTYAQLLDLPSTSLTATLECVGNGRSLLVPKTKGVQWDLGAVSTAKWTGVTLATILGRAGLRDGVVDVILEGADEGEPSSEPKPPGIIHFARSLPVAKALSPTVILAHQMNDQVLPAAHGFPLRAVVGGWYGMASIKWLTRIVVTDRLFLGYDQSIDYTVWERRDGIPNLTPVTNMQVKASIARPSRGESLPANADYRVHGAAWAGEAEVVKVDLSTDGGRSWRPARLLGEPVPLCWRLWEYTWKAPAPGKHILMARATDKGGQAQPMERDPDRRNYMISHVQPTEVEVRG